MKIALSVLAPVRRAALGVVAGIAFVLGLAHCSSGTSSTTGTATSASSVCQTVCNCVSGQGGDSAQCLSQCNDIASASHDLKNDCESELKTRGYSTCQDTCNGFGSTSSGTAAGGGAAAAGETATLGDFCAKCAECVGDGTFSEGFCAPFATAGGGFDVASCTAKGSRSELRQPSLAKSTLTSLSCSGFDSAE
jgi:hypothetical protein